MKGTWLIVSLILVALCPVAVNAQAISARYWSDAWRGWHFYEDPEPDAEDRPAPLPMIASPAPKPKPAKAPEIVEFELLQKTLEESRNIAIMRPTEANVRRYMELESRVVARASTFADVAQRVAWTTPDLDPTLQGRPVNAKALEVFEQQQMSQRSESIGALDRDHVLFFVFCGDCPTAMPSRRRWKRFRRATASR